MKNIKATCRTETCVQNGVTHEFNSDTLFTVCAMCGLEVTDIIAEDIEDADTAKTE